MLPAATIVEEPVDFDNQRKVNIYWEITQSLIALMISGAVVFAALKKIESEALGNAFFLIVGFYFSRTNHANILGKKQVQVYER